MPKKLNSVKEVIRKPFFYVSLALFTSFIVAHATYIIDSPWTNLFLNLSLVVIAGLVVEGAIRLKGAAFPFYRRRYQILLGIGMGTSLLITYSEAMGSYGLLVPLFMYKVYNSICKGVGDDFTITMGNVFLILGLAAAPLSVVLGHYEGSKAFILSYSFLLSSIIFTLVIEALEKPMVPKVDLTVANSYLYQNSLGLISDLVGGAVTNVQADGAVQDGTDTCPVDIKLQKEVHRVRTSVDEVTNNPSIKNYLKGMHSNFKARNHRIIYTGWEDNIKGEKAVIILSLIKYFVELSVKTTERGPGLESVTWITHTPGRVSLRDSDGGDYVSPEEVEELDLIESFTSDEFYELYGVRVKHASVEGHDVYNGMETIILF